MNRMPTLFEGLNFEGKEVRVVGTAENLVFVLRDVCDVLEIQHTQPIVQRYKEGGVFSKYTIEDSFGRLREMTMVNEEGLYEILFDSRKDEAKRFRKWVTRYVLPSIRKDGGYIAATKEDTPEEILARAVLVAQKTLERVEQEKQAALNQLKDQAPKVLFANAVETSETSILVGQLAKIITQNGVKVGQNRLFHWLREHGYLGKTGAHRNEPTQYSVERGWFEVTERTVQNPDGSVRITRTTKVTGKGQVYFTNKFLKGDK